MIYINAIIEIERFSYEKTNSYSSCHLDINHYYHEWEKNAYKNGLLLLNVIPHMLNKVNTGGQTPLDIAYTSKTSGRLIGLFREHGGLTAQEVVKKENSLLSIDALQKLT